MYLTSDPSVSYIELNQGLTAIVDTEDLDKLLQYTWHAYKDYNTFYCQRNLYVGKYRMHQTMHIFLTGYKMTDHINGNGLDNRKSNLREVTNQQNVFNSRKTVHPTTSKFKGVSSMLPSSNKWHAQITINRKKIHLGLFKSETEAALAYDEAAREYFGEFATLNFPKEGESYAIRA